MAIVDLFPTGDVSTGWDQGTGSTFDEINEGVDTPNDTDFIQETAGNGTVSRFSFANRPTDFATTTSLTIKIRHRADSFVDDSDFFEVRVFGGGAQIGATKNASHSETITDESFTDANWDAMSAAEIDALEVSVTYNKSSSSMPDSGRNIKIFEMEAVLEYDLAVFPADDITFNDAPTVFLQFGVTSQDDITFDDAVLGVRPIAFEMAASGNIVASGEDTTFQLTAPATKSTSDFDAGRIQDDENPADTVDILSERYTELEWCISAKPGAREVQYSFRVTNNGVVINTYTLTPKLTIIATVGGPPPRRFDYQPYLAR